jgi:hypothetical protein
MSPFAEIMQVRICREKTSKNVYAMKNLKKSEMLRRGQVPCMVDLCYLVYYYCFWLVNCPLTFVHICQVEHAKAENNFLEEVFFCEKHRTNIDTHTHMSTHPYKYMHAHPIHMSTSERLSRFDLGIHKVDHQERLVVDGDVVSH